MHSMFGRNKDESKDESKGASANERVNLIDSTNRANNYQTFSNVAPEEILNELLTKFDEVQRLNVKIKSKELNEMMPEGPLIEGLISQAFSAIGSIIQDLKKSADNKAQEIIDLVEKFKIENKMDERLKKLDVPFYKLAEKISKDISKGSYDAFKSSLGTIKYTKFNEAILFMLGKHNKLFPDQHKELFSRDTFSLRPRS